MNKEKLQNHLDQLQRTHDDLDSKIKVEYVKYGDDHSVSEMKKRKLHIKDEIEALKLKMES
jgi:hypothetical protein